MMLLYRGVSKVWKIYVSGLTSIRFDYFSPRLLRWARSHYPTTGTLTMSGLQRREVIRDEKHALSFLDKDY